MEASNTHAVIATLPELIFTIAILSGVLMFFYLIVILQEKAAEIHKQKKTRYFFLIIGRLWQEMNPFQDMQKLNGTRGLASKEILFFTIWAWIVPYLGVLLLCLPIFLFLDIITFLFISKDKEEG